MESKKEIIKNRKIDCKDFYWKRFSPSWIVRDYFKKVFVYLDKDFLNNFEIKSIKWENNKFIIILKSINNLDIFEFEIKKKLDNCKWFFCTENICIDSKDKNKDFYKFLINIKNKWGVLNLEYFLKILLNDPKIKKEYYQIFWKSERPPFSIIQDWGNHLHKMRFIVHEWIFRNLDQSLEFNLGEIKIQHSERECLWISPEIASEKIFKFFNFPKEHYNHKYDKLFYLTKEEKELYIWRKKITQILEFTDLNEDDIIMWKWTEKLEDTINNSLNAITKNNIKMLSFNCCCVPRIVGDDVYSVLDRAKKKTEIPFIIQGQLEKTPFEQKVILLESYLSKINTEKIQVKKNSISLFWYHENKYLKLLNDLLIKKWVKINSIFIPTIDVRLLPLMFQSELFVFSPNKFSEEIFEYPFKAMWIKYISPVFPYWKENTKKWFEIILNQLWLKYEISKNEKNIISDYEDKIKYVKEKKYRVWIVCVWKKEVLKFINPDYMNNVDIISFLEEMWFWIDFYIYNNFSDYIEVNNEEKYTREDWDINSITKIIEDKIINKKDLKINFFSEEKEMYALLNKQKPDALYSDIYYDDRISNLWINQFNVRNFYLWYFGALDTINEIIKLIELSYFKNYYKYF